MKVALFSGSVYGVAEDVARRAQSLLQSAGLETCYSPRATLADLLDFAPDALLAVTSTTGLGELPDSLYALYAQMREQLPAAWRGLPGAVIALGDASYVDTFCGAGEIIRELFAELGIREVQPMLRLDASETVDQEEDAEPWLKDLIDVLKDTSVPGRD
jgi:MioC protein